MPATDDPPITVEGLDPMPPEPPAPAPAADPAPVSGKRRPTHDPTWDDVERAREEEKNKLYPRLTKAEEELAAFRAEQVEREKAAKKAAKEAEEARLAAEREKLTAAEQIELMRSEQEKRFAAMQEELEMERTLRQKEREWSDLMQYKAGRLNEVADQLMPDLVEYISGNTREEIDLSIQRAIDKTNQIMGNVQQQLQGIRAAAPGVAPTGAPATGPGGMDGTGQVLTPDDIRNMTAEEYAASREQLHAAVRRARR